MTPHEIELALALKGLGCVGSRFTGSIAYMAIADPQRELSLRQWHYMEIMAWGAIAASFRGISSPIKSR